MKILIAGATGFIGQHLVKHFTKQHFELTLLGRNTNKIKSTFATPHTALSWSELNSKHIAQQQLIINLAGANIGDKRWSIRRKQEILDSRIKTTHLLANFCAQLGKASPALF